MRARIFRAAAAACCVALAGCSLYVLTDPYGNQYGGWYNPGANDRYQLVTCEHEIDEQKVPDAGRKDFMRCCMWRHGVPIDDARSCGAATG
jgi:hypothetical protein